MRLPNPRPTAFFYSFLLIFFLLTVSFAADADLAKKEGQIVIYGAAISDIIKPLKDGFSRRYPGIQVEVMEGTGSRLRERVRAEQRAGKAVADLFASGTGSLWDLKKDGFLQPYLSPETAHMPSWGVDSSGLTTPCYLNAYGITLNTRLVPPAG